MQQKQCLQQFATLMKLIIIIQHFQNVHYTSRPSGNAVVMSSNDFHTHIIVVNTSTSQRNRLHDALRQTMVKGMLPPVFHRSL